MEDSVSMDRGWGGGDGVGMTQVHYIYFCTLFLLSLHQYHLRLSGIRSRRLGTQDVKYHGQGTYFVPSACSLGWGGAEILTTAKTRYSPYQALYRHSHLIPMTTCSEH